MDTPTELAEEELRGVLEAGHGAVADAPRRLMVCHTPPYDTRLDRLMNGQPVGTPAVRSFIETRQPDLALVGHIREGRGTDGPSDMTDRPRHPRPELDVPLRNPHTALQSRGP
jgi:Icc-related predicted phosphoesterase